MTVMEGNGFAVQLSYLQIVIMVVTVVLMAAFTLLISRTSLGRAQRACEQDQKMASLLGVNVDRTISLTFVTGAALAAVAGLMVTLYYGVVDFFIGRSEEHTSELQSLMRISYAVFCLKKKKNNNVYT